MQPPVHHARRSCVRMSPGTSVAAVVATLALPALAVVPVAGVEPGVQAALKLACLAVAGAAWGLAARGAGGFTATERALLAFVTIAGLTTLCAGTGLALAGPGLVSATALLLVARGVRVAMRGSWRAIEVAVLVTAVAAAALALLELLGVHLPWTGPRRPESTMGNRNYLAGYLVIALPVVVAAALRGRRHALPAVVLVTAVLGVTRCRGAYLAAIAALTLALAVQWWRRREPPAPARGRVRACAVALALGLGLAALPWPGVHFGPSIADALGRVVEHDRGSGQARVQQHLVGLAALTAAPSRWLTGHGAGGWQDAASAHAHAIGGHTRALVGPAAPNSEPLRVAVEHGLPGLLALLVALVLGLRGLLRPAGDAGASSPPRCTRCSTRPSPAPSVSRCSACCSASPARRGRSRRPRACATGWPPCSPRSRCWPPVSRCCGSRRR